MSYDNVKSLRQNQTAVEQLLWAQLRRKRIGSRFRRQHAIGPFIVDSYCHAARLAIEIDGEDHGAKHASDERRTAWLNRYGLAVVRFSNRDGYENLEGVVRTIEALVRAAKPSPFGRRKLHRSFR
jgi:very-short-patch-repair endonuclease